MANKSVPLLAVSCCVLWIALLAAQASVVLTDFESAADQSVEASEDGSHGVAVVTNACALSGAGALWMGPYADKMPAEDYGYAEVFWTDPSKRDWSHMDRFVFETANLSQRDADVVFYLFDSGKKKSRRSRFRYRL